MHIAKVYKNHSKIVCLTLYVDSDNPVFNKKSRLPFKIWKNFVAQIVEDTLFL